jgi:apolipoprotein N-acyltransferase
MNTQSNKNFSILLLLAGTVLVGFSMGRWLAPLAAWIGPVLIMRYARDHKGWRGYLFLLAAYTVAFLIGFGQNWLAQLPALVFILPLFYGFLWTLPYLADKFVGRRLQGFATTLAYPLAATTLEFVNIHTNPVGMWGATGFTQYGNLAFMQFASVTGMIGITFLMGWFASVANWAWENRGRGSETLRGLAAFGVVMIAVFTFGFLRLNLAPASETIRVAGITAQSQTILRQAEDPGAIVQSHWNAYFVETAREAQAGAQVILWPEGAGLTFNSDESVSLVAQAQEVARQNEVYLVIGYGMIYSEGGKPWQNKLLVIDPTGAIVLQTIRQSFNRLDKTTLVCSWSPVVTVWK